MSDSDGLLRWTDDDVRVIRRHWQALMDAVTWEDLCSPQIGQLSRLRKRVLESGEKLHSLVADKSWIPSPRDRIKSTLATALAAEEALQQVQTQLQGLDDNAAARVTARLFADLAQAVSQQLAPRKQQWAVWLDRQAGTSPPV